MKATDGIFMKILPEIYLRTKKKLWNFGSCALLDHEDMVTCLQLHYIRTPLHAAVDPA